MTKTIDYYFSVVSPWTFMGHQRLYDIAAKHGATIREFPLTLGGIFPKTGGVPLSQRPIERQQYRLVELKRWSSLLGLSMNIHPKHFPTSDVPGGLLCLALTRRGQSCGALAKAIMAACWQEEKLISDWDCLHGIAASQGLDADGLVAEARDEAMMPHLQANADAALAVGMFGSPWYQHAGEGFWGQDRLDLLDKKLSGAY